MQILWNNFLGLGEAIISLLLLIDGVVYWFISKLYSLYIVLAQAKIFKEAMYVDIANKVYLIMGVVALFICVYALLQSIINPDTLKKSGADFVKKFLLGIIMIILTPSIFNFLYTLQDSILSDNVIQNILLRNNNSNNSANGVYVTYFYDKDNPNLTTLELKEKLDNKEISLTDFEDDPYGTSESRKVIRYAVSEECEYKDDYAQAMANCEKVTINNGNNTLIKQYGNRMAFIVLEAFLHPTVTGSNPIVDASNAAYAPGKSTAGWVGCAVGGIGAIVVGVAGTIGGIWTFGGTTAAGWAGAAAIAGAACGAGALAGNEVYEAVNYKEYSWSNFEREAIYDGAFDRITSFVGEGKKGNMGVIGDEYSYMPIVSTICGLILVYMLLSYCIDLGVRASKLAFYQMFAPVSFLLNTIPGQKDLLGNWVKAVLTTWGEVFIRIFTMIAAVYLISNLDMVTFESLGSEALVAKAIIVIGIVTFMKQFPKLLGDLTGIKSENMKLGIMDKLNAGTFGLAGGLVGGFTGAIGGAIASKRYGGTIMGGLASGAVGGFQGKGNQWKKQANKQYSSLTGDHKGKVGVFGGKTVGTRINNQVGAMNKRSQNVATVERNNRIAKNKEELAKIENAWLETNVDEKQRIADFEMSGEYQTCYNYVQTDESVQKDIARAQREWEIANTSSAKKLSAEEYAAKKNAAFTEISETKLRAATQDYMRKYYTQAGADHKDYKTDTNSTAQYLRDLDKNKAAEKQYNDQKAAIQKAIKKDEDVQKALGEQQVNDEWVKNMKEMFKKTGLDKEFKKDDKK